MISSTAFFCRFIDLISIDSEYDSVLTKKHSNFSSCLVLVIRVRLDVLYGLMWYTKFSFLAGFDKNQGQQSGTKPPSRLGRLFHETFYLLSSICFWICWTGDLCSRAILKAFFWTACNKKMDKKNQHHFEYKFDLLEIIDFVFFSIRSASLWWYAFLLQIICNFWSPTGSGNVVFLSK